jgi:hypothetical protein
MGTTVELVLGGTAQVYCVHDREKRQVVTEAQVAELGLESGIVYDPRQHRTHRCACCSNLFVDPSDEPRYCDTCNPAARLVHSLGAPLALPIGEVDG